MTAMKTPNIIRAVSCLLPYPPCTVLVWWTIQRKDSISCIADLNFCGGLPFLPFS